MTAQTVTGDKRGFKAPGTTFMITGGLIGALGAYAFQLVGLRALGTAEFAPVSLLWTTFFILATVLLVPVEQYVTREVASGRRALPTDLKPAAVMAAVGAIVGGGFVTLTLDELFRGDPQYIVQIVLLMAGYGLLMTAKGVLAGRRRFAGVGWVLIVETLVRLMAGIAAVVLIANAVSLGWAMVIGGFSVLALRWWRHDEGDSDQTPTPPGRFLAGYAGGTSSAQLLLAGAPLGVAALGGSDALISIVFFTFIIYRAPLTLIFALQGRILPFLVGLAGSEKKSELARIAKWVFRGGLVLAVAGAGVGWLIGPDVMRVLLGPEAAPSHVVAMLAAGGVMAAAAAQVTSQVLVAEGRTTRLAWAWFVGLLVGLVVTVLVTGAPDTRVAIGFAAGELAALGLMTYLATTHPAALST
jgi:O-antigen/teichoic acid export membrane protein